MSARKVTNQAELDQALADKAELIEIHSPAGVLLVIRENPSSRVVLWESSSAVLWGSSRAVLRDSSSAVLRDSSRAELRDSSSAVLRESSRAVASEASTVSMFGGSLKAAPFVAVHLHSATANVKGGVIIDHTSVKDMDGSAWCKYHGVEVRRGIATLFKAVNDQWTTDRGADYSPGSKPKCDDFKDTDACGNGLHFGPSPSHARSYFDSATKYVAVGVKVSELRPITGSTAKAKAPRVVRACVEVDIHGEPVAVTP